MNMIKVYLLVLDLICISTTSLIKWMVIKVDAMVTQ